MSGFKDPPKETRFTKDNQPSGKAKSRGKLLKNMLKKRIMEEFEPMIEKLIQEVKENGNVQAFDKIMDRGFGKVTEKKKLNHDVHGSLNKILQTQFFKDE